MMTLSELWKQFRLLTDPQNLSEADRSFLQRFLVEEQKLREKKRLEHLLHCENQYLTLQTVSDEF